MISRNDLFSFTSVPRAGYLIDAFSILFYLVGALSLISFFWWNLSDIFFLKIKFNIFIICPLLVMFVFGSNLTGFFDTSFL